MEVRKDYCTYCRDYGFELYIYPDNTWLLEYTNNITGKKVFEDGAVNEKENMNNMRQMLIDRGLLFSKSRISDEDIDEHFYKMRKAWKDCAKRGIHTQEWRDLTALPFELSRFDD